MCRLAAFPPGTTKDEAIRIAKSLEQNNLDGVGTSYLKDGEFIVHKLPIALTKALEMNYSLFDHMPHDGWTIFHTRLGTHGENEIRNTHPFTNDKYSLVHNGVWYESGICRFALQGLVEFGGETDSEVALYFFGRHGPDNFHKALGRGGVFMAIEKSTGELHVAKNSGDLNIWALDRGDAKEFPTGRVVVASELRDVTTDKDIVLDCEDGVYIFNSDGTPQRMAKTRDLFRYNYGGYGYGSRYRGGCESAEDACSVPHRSTFSRHRDAAPIVGAVEKKSSGSLNLWSLDPNEYVVEMLGIR